MCARASTSAVPAVPSLVGRTRRRVLWIGGAPDIELALVRDALARDADVLEAATPRAAADLAAAVAGRSPAFAVLAADRAGRFSSADAVLVSRAWPLVPLVSAASSLVDGRRRSGPPLPGVEEVPWHDLPGRARWWLAALDAGLPSSLGLPATARREERVLDAVVACGRAAAAAMAAGPVDVAVAASRPEAVEGLCDLIDATGHAVVRRVVGRPPVDVAAAALLWDAGDLDPDRIEWLRLVSANRPGLFIVVLDSFPRGDTTVAAVRAGAAAVLGRPVSLEALAGTLLAAADAGSQAVEKVLRTFFHG